MRLGELMVVSEAECRNRSLGSRMLLLSGFKA